jgi:hypothetical protein
MGPVGALYDPEVAVVPNVPVVGIGGGAAKDGVGGGAAGDCGVDGIGGGADDNGEEYVKPLGLGSGADCGMDDDGNCGGCASCEGCAVGATGVPQPRQTLSLDARIRPHFLQIGILVRG